MKINVTNHSHIGVLQALATIANKTTHIEDMSVIVEDKNRIKSSEVSKTRVTHSNPVKMRCLGVPGKSFIIRDGNSVSVTGNTMHVEGNSKVFKTVCSDHKRIVTDKFKKEIYEMARAIVDLEDKFIDMVYQDFVIEGLDKDEVKNYIRFIADRRLIQLGLKGNYNVKTNPLKWLEWLLGGSNHTNFFENKVSEYEVGGLVGENMFTKDKKYKLVGRDGCPYCVKAVEEFIDNGFDFEEIKINDQAERNKFYDSLHLVGKERTVPQIWDITEDNSHVYIGGYKQLKEHILENKIKKDSLSNESEDEENL